MQARHKKYISLDEYVEKQKKDPEFVELYRKELFINEIAKMLTEMRQKARLTQAELANKAGTTQPVIARLESGKDSRIPSLELLTRLAAASHAKLNLEFVFLDNEK